MNNAMHTAMNTIEQFNQYAVKENLSAGAILLWQRLYFTMSRKGQFADVAQNTSVLMAMLDITRQGLQQMRQTLIDKGFLAIRQDEHQQIFYTLMLNGNVVGEKPVGNSHVEDVDKKQYWATPDGSISAQKFAPASSTSTDFHKLYDVGAVDHNRPCKSTTRPNITDESHHFPPGDIILTNRYRQYIDTFCDKFGPAAKGDLLQWVDMRMKNGWTLTLMGLEAVLRNLIELSAGDAIRMGQIVAQSVKRRWKGFFPLKVEAKPSGEKLRRQEEKQEQQQRRQQRHPGYERKPWQKCAPEGRDLSFLEV